MTVTQAMMAAHAREEMLREELSAVAADLRLAADRFSTSWDDEQELSPIDLIRRALRRAELALIALEVSR